VVGCGPFSIFEGTVEAAAPPGTSPLRAWVAIVEGGDVKRQQRVAAPQLVIADEPTKRWELALTEDQDLESLVDGFYGYPVDSGTGTLADLVAVQALSTWGLDRIVDRFFPRFGQQAL
jgi:hypothetical protein